MGAVAISERIHDTIMGAAPEGAIEFFHGYTYSGHPASCAAGIATLDIYRNEGLFERGRELSPYFLDALFSLKDIPVVADIRGYGMMAAIDVHADGAPGQARPRLPEEAVRQRPQSQDHRRLRDHRAAADRREEARRRDRRHPAQDARGALTRTCPRRAAARPAARSTLHQPRGRTCMKRSSAGVLFAAFAARAGMGAEGSDDRLPGHGRARTGSRRKRRRSRRRPATRSTGSSSAAAAR